jgi:steroid delta-isomerase-like uncharacterized protein
MRQPFHMTGGLRVVSIIITTLLRLGLPVGPSALLSVRGRTSGKIYTIPIALVENGGTSFLVAAFGEVNWVRNLRAASKAHLNFRVTPHSPLADFEQEALYHPVFRIVSKKGAYLMSTEDNKEIVRRFYGEGVHNPAIFDELLAPTYVLHLPGSPPIAGIEQAKQLMVAYTSAFPDLQLTTEDVVAEGDKVAIRNTWRGTHHGAFQGLPSTGKHVMFTGSDFFRFVGGKIAEQWADLDALGLMQQLGGIPAMG